MSDPAPYRTLGLGGKSGGPKLERDRLPRGAKTGAPSRSLGFTGPLLSILFLILNVLEAHVLCFAKVPAHGTFWGFLTSRFLRLLDLQPRQLLGAEPGR